MSIPKHIVYAWFGGQPKPRLVQKCIDSWKRVVPDYEITELNESNWDIEKYKYTKQAYEQKKYAFVSDVSRCDWLYENGGISLDGDVEILKPFTDDILSQRAFTSKESAGRWVSAIIASEANHPWVYKILKYYSQNDFIYDPKNICNTTIIDQINRKWYKETVGDIIYLHEGVAIYPRTYFECKNWATGQIELNKNSYCIHHYNKSWL